MRLRDGITTVVAECVVRVSVIFSVIIAPSGATTVSSSTIHTFLLNLSTSHLEHLGLGVFQLDLFHTIPP